MLSGGFCSCGLSLKDVDDEGSLAFGGPALRAIAIAIGVDLDGGRNGGFGLTDVIGLQAEDERWQRRMGRRGVDICLILDQFGVLITCPIHEEDLA